MITDANRFIDAGLSLSPSRKCCMHLVLHIFEQLAHQRDPYVVRLKRRPANLIHPITSHPPCINIACLSIASSTLLPKPSQLDNQLLCSTMPSISSLGTCTAIISSILESLSLMLHLPSGPPPYNHAHPSHDEHPQRAHWRYQDLWISVTSSVLISVPNSISHHYNIPRSAHRKGKAQSIHMVDITHHSVTKRSGEINA